MKRPAAVNALVAALLAASVGGCGPPSGQPVVECGPLDAEQCREQAGWARAFVSENWPGKTVTRIEFSDETGAYRVTFSDGSHGWVGQ